jgi:membrane protease YdiL (CAAX protease family)
MTLIDHVLVLGLVIALPVYGTVSYRSLLRALQRGERGATLREYWGTIGLEWGLVAAVLAAWWWAGRSLGALGLQLPSGSPLYWGVGVTVPVLGFLGYQWIQIKRLDPTGYEPLRKQLGGAIGFLPRTDSEYRVFRLLALTAGICEEILFRGYLIWYAGTFIGTWPAVVLTSIAFGLGHWYQGPSGVLKTGVVGLLAGALLVASQSLLWPIILHAAVDLQGGAVGRLVSQSAGQPPESPGAARPE